MKNIVEFLNEAKTVNKKMTLKQFIDWYLGEEDGLSKDNAIDLIDGENGAFMVEPTCPIKNADDLLKMYTDKPETSLTVSFEELKVGPNNGGYQFTAKANGRKIWFYGESSTLYPKDNAWWD